jgi:hypothetical protein
MRTTVPPESCEVSDVVVDDRGFFNFTPFEMFLVGTSVCLVQFFVAMTHGLMAGESDFGVFLATTKRFTDGATMYASQQVDFTPPAFHIVLIPLTYLDSRLAFVLWTAANTIAAVFVVRTCLRALPGGWKHRWVVAAWVANAAGVQMTVRLGQVSWLVALLVLPAWLAARSSRHWAAGLSMGVAMAFKPFLLVGVLVFLVRRQWRMLAASVIAAAASCSASIILCGWTPFRDWLMNLTLTPDPAYATHALNSSWLALIARLGLPALSATVCSILTVVVMMWRVRRANEDEAWLLLLLSAILASPMGWVYYQPLLIGPVLALTLNGRLKLPRWVRLASVVPTLRSTQFQLSGPLLAATLGSIYFWACLGLFAVVGMRRTPDEGVDMVVASATEAAA